MNHLLALQIVLPAFTAALLLVLQRAPVVLVRALSAAATLGLFAAAIAVLAQAEAGTPLVYQVGNWPAPFESCWSQTVSPRSCFC